MILRLAAAAGAAVIVQAGISESDEPFARQTGEQLYRQCYSCHSLRPGENLPSGPTLHSIVGKAVAAEEEFDYSPALREFSRGNRRWTPALLDRYIAEPEALVPGTHMSFHGMADRRHRSALIDYLQKH